MSNGIPVSLSLKPTLEAENIGPDEAPDKKRILAISFYALLVSVVVCIAARFLVFLIEFFTGLFYYGRLSGAHEGPAGNTLGAWAILVPVAGGLIVGLMAYYGSKAIRGHGIPEAMEQILTNQSRIRPSIIYLKPLSAAISIGTGGPFGAEGPIIATGGAFGSAVGQLLKISDQERKVLLTAGAAAGMSAIFGSPLAAIFLAIELLLFEFSPRSIIPVSLSCIVGAAGHHLLFGNEPVFAMHDAGIISSPALAGYCAIGVAMGLLSAGVTKAVYFIEDLFEKIPFHWAWWPAIGGVAVGIAGYFDPRTLGVGYNNITDVLAGNMTLRLLLSLCIIKFVSWAIALGSGTSGGTLAPLLTIGGAAGALLGLAMRSWLPHCEVSVSLSALMGMSAMFAGSSRALITSIVFALETTSCTTALLPLIGACTASYFVSFFMMKNTIMTEKIARRGVRTPQSYEPDVLEKTNAADAMKWIEEEVLFSSENTIGEIMQWQKTHADFDRPYFIVTTPAGEFLGIVETAGLFQKHDPRTEIGHLLSPGGAFADAGMSLRTVAGIMAREKRYVMPVMSAQEGRHVTGIISAQEIIAVYDDERKSHQRKEKHLSFRRGTLKILLRGQKMISLIRTKNADRKPQDH
ncbi:MAG TPA: chloride channel protein [Bacteroidia bacterium]|nr:chloride channel protein [Bacteroidia bacterium]